FAHFGARSSGMFEQQMIEGGSLDLKRLGFAREAAVPKHQLQRAAAVAQMELSAKLDRKAGRLQSRQYTHLFEQRTIVWQQRLTNVESRKMFLLQKEDALAGSRQERRSRA